MRALQRCWLAAWAASLVASLAWGQLDSPPPLAVSAARTGQSATWVRAGLDRTIALSLDRVTLRTALDTIAARGQVRLLYARGVVPLDNTVSLTASTITVADALRAVLATTGVGVTIAPGGQLVLRALEVGQPVLPAPVADLGYQQGTATISGYVRDSATGASIPAVMVRVDGTALETQSGTDGAYKITGVTAGEYRVTARRVGYLAKTRTITVSEGQSVTANFGLNPPATKLDEVVTTALGEQRRYQVGNVIATINVDSIAPTAPVTSVTDLIEGRAAGVEVMETSGLVGGGEAIRIRGQSSLLVQGDPIIIVDGVREDNSPGGSSGALSPMYNFVPSPSRINDLDFTQIATIDILKGPAATTEYGTDAANGVIVITTKRGTAGVPQWHVSVTQSASIIPTDFPDDYYTWGHGTDGTGGIVNCPVVPIYGGQYAANGYLYHDPVAYLGSVQASCVADSVVHFNPLNHASTTEFGTGPSGKYNLDVSGGSDAFRYYLAAGLSNAIGGTKLPDVFRSQALTLGVPPSDLNPNSLQQRSAKANTSIRLGQTADVQLNVGYTSTFQNTPSTPVLIDGLTLGPALDDSADDYGYGHQGLNHFSSPLAELSQVANQQVDALTAGVTATWRPVAWLVAHTTLGLQHESQQVQQTDLPAASIVGFNEPPNSGGLSFADGGTDLYTVDFRTAATASLVRSVKSVTSLGVQMVDNRTQAVQGLGFGLTTQNGQSLGAGNYLTASQSAARSATLGGYLEEQLGYVDRLFVTGALRVDAGSGFGRSYSTAEYPKLSVSWLALDNGGTSVRLRGALGGAGKQPPPGASLQTFFLSSVLADGAPSQGFSLSTPGSPGLQPERTIESEGGFDISLWRNRVTVEFTGYSKTTQNAIYPITLGFDLSNATLYENLGEVTNSGLEETITAVLLENRVLTWNVTVNSSTNNNKLVHLAPGVQATAEGQSAGAYQYFSAGYPLYGYWANAVQYADLNHDGILEPNEVTVDTAPSYRGSSLPKYQTSLATSVSLWRGAVAIGALFDYQTGFKIQNYTVPIASTNSLTRAQNVLGAPLWWQAQEFNGSTSYQSGDFLRFRELNMTYALPRGWAHAARLSSLSLTAAVRNLALWTRYQGDPEASGSSYAGNYQPSSNSEVINNDLRDNLGDVPLMRSWTVRLNVGL